MATTSDWTGTSTQNKPKKPPSPATWGGGLVLSILHGCLTFAEAERLVDLSESLNRIGHGGCVHPAFSQPPFYFASDGLINYRTAADRGLLQPGQRYLIAAAGLGAVFSAMVFQH